MDEHNDPQADATDKLPDQARKNLANEAPEEVAEQVTDVLPDQAADALAERAADALPDQAADALAGRVADAVPEQVADAHPEQATDVIPDQAIDVLSDQVQEEAADQVRDVLPDHVRARLAGRVAEVRLERVGDVVLDQVGVVGRRFGVGAGEVVEVVGGVANRGFVVGEGLFLRVARVGFEADLRKEMAVIPVARAAGVLTPAIVEYDESRSVIDAPYVVMERVHGTEPIDVPAGLGEQLARLHRAQAANVLGVPEDGWGDPWRTVDDLAERGYLDLGMATWLAGWFTRLAGRFDWGRPKVLIHGDVAAHNLLATPNGRLAGLIDWGDAALAPAEVDFAKLPLEQVAAILPDYVRHTGSAVPEEGLAAATLWLHLEWALGKLPADPWPGQRHWTAPPASRVLGILRFFAAAPPDSWSSLT